MTQYAPHVIIPRSLPTLQRYSPVKPRPPSTHYTTEDLLSQVELRDPVSHRAVHGVAISGEQQVTLSVHTTAQGRKPVVELAHGALYVYTT